MRFDQETISSLEEPEKLSQPVTSTSEKEEASTDLHRIRIGDREFVLIGTAHISRDSVEIVEQTIAAENPDTVCVELDQQRYEALLEPDRWKSLDLVKVIRKGQGPYLLTSLMLSAFQKKMGLQTGVKPGAELLAAVQTAEKHGSSVKLIDREIRITLLRAWRKTGLWKKMQLLAAMISGIFESQKIDEEQLAKLRQTDTLTAIIDDMGAMLPSVKTILVDERDLYMATELLNSDGKKIVGVVGAAHVPGIIRWLTKETDLPDTAELLTVPEKTFFSKLLPWTFPSVVALLFVAGFFFADPGQLTNAALAWVLANGLLASLGTAVALGHPITVITAFVAAPITSLNPTIGAGFVTGLVQALVAGPTVQDLENVNLDLTTVSGWWRNRMIRVLLVFLFSSVGSTVGTLVAFKWLAQLV